MRNRRKIVYHQKQIDKLSKRIHILEEENKSLEQENKSLFKINEVNKKCIANLKSEQAKVLDSYNVGMTQLRDLKEKYKMAIKSTRNIQKDYENKMQLLMQQLKKQKK